MPFDALTGLREAIAAKERVTEPRRYLSEDAIAEINETLVSLHKGEVITITYYGIYEQAYKQLTGPVTRIDSYWNSLQLGDISIEFSEIFDILVNTEDRCGVLV